MQQNVGNVDAYIRLTCGFTMLSYATARMIKNPNKEGSIAMAGLAAMKIAEGISRYCPMIDCINRTLESKNMQKKQQAE
ncbi:DUF2892 domain-containing protein [Radiobacillus kanasensis]|uniref:YgaP family membrane protein n=1 Tax=Radiobacillus kanasensis TaxID=2844358 RepID=UPI001E4B7653|nr:DUF2892 domain-containing protein [Radiobacillus kanasensis]UFT99917.1 DUF2892 domain-containing protein [Radiobacillus kanasensis]